MKFFFSGSKGRTVPKRGKRSGSAFQPRLERLEGRRMLAAVTLSTPSVSLGDGNWVLQDRQGTDVHVGPAYLYYDIDVASTFPGFQVGDTLYLKVNYFDEGSGKIRVQYDSTQQNFDLTDYHSRSSRIDTQQFVSSHHILGQAEFANGSNGDDFRVSTLGAPVSTVEISDQPFAGSGLDWVFDVPWESAYDGPSRDDVDASTLTGKILTGYQGWFDTPNDQNDEGYRHWGQPGDWHVDQWPDPNDYDASELFSVPGVSTSSGDQAYLFSSNQESVVRRHFQWMRQHNIDGVFLQRFSEAFVSRNADGSYSGENQWPLVNARDAAHLEGRTWAIEYDIQSGSDEATRDQIIQKVKDDWEFLTESDGLDMLGDSRYQREDGKPVVAIFGLYLNSEKAYTTAQQTDLVNYFQSRGVYVIGAGRHSESTAQTANAGLHDAYIPWQGYWKGGSSYAPAETRLDGVTEHIPHVFPGFSWTHLQDDSAASSIDREDGAYYWRMLEDAVNETDSPWLFIGMFDEYDEGTNLIPASDDPPVPDNDPNGIPLTFQTSDPSPNDWWMALTGEAKDALQGKTLFAAMLPSESALENRSNVGGEVQWQVQTSDRLKLINMPDGSVETTQVTHNGQTFDAAFSSDPYLYFQVDDSFLFQELDGRDVTIEVEYLDSSNGTFRLEYDSTNQTFQPSESVLLTDSGQWRTHRFDLTDADFGNDQNGSNDFRIEKSGGNLLIRRVRVIKENMLSVGTNLGASNISDGLQQVEVGDGQTVATTTGGRDTRIVTGTASSQYMYLRVNDDFANQVSAGSNAIVEIVYQDLGTGNLSIQYDSTDGAYKASNSVVLANSNQWRTERFYLDDAYLGNSQNGGSDFRILGNGIPIDQVRVLQSFGDLIPPELQTSAVTLNASLNMTTVSWTLIDDWQTGLTDQWTVPEDNRVRLEWTNDDGLNWSQVDEVLEGAGATSQSTYDLATGRAFWTGSYHWDTSGLDAGTYRTRVTPIDGRGNLGSAVESVELDLTPPTLISLTRESPILEDTSADTLVFRATFDEQVVSVAASDFEISDFETGGGTTGSVTGVAAVAGTSEAVYLLTVSGGNLGSFNGAVGVSLSESQSITDTASNRLFNVEPAIDEVFTVDNNAPLVESVVRDGGNSVVRSITVQFDSLVSIDPGAFELTGGSGALVVVNSETSTPANKTLATLTFSGGQVDNTGSLINGNYQLRIVDSKVRDSSDNRLDGDGDGNAGIAHIDDFFRLFGDSNGDRAVGLTDFASFRGAFGSQSGDTNFDLAFDADNSSDIGLADFAAFRSNFGTTLGPPEQ